MNQSLGITEANVNLDVALRCERILTARGYTVRMSRRTDVFIPLQQRAAEANSWGANYFISIHSNSSIFSHANGCEVLYYPTSVRGKQLAEEVLHQLLLQTHLTDRGVQPRPDLAVLRLTNMPAILTEMAFISNPTEGALLATPEFRQQCAQGIADGVTQYIIEHNLTLL